MEIRTDFLVIGSGLAGLSFAIKASLLGSVAIITKKNTMEANTNYAQGGIAAVMDLEDSFSCHTDDTLRAGAGLCREDVVRFVVEEGPERIRELIDWGVQFSKKGGAESPFDLGKEGGHTVRRVLHAADSTGREIERALVAKANSLGNIRIYENFLAIDLILESKVRGKKTLPREEQDRCLGAYVFDIDNDRVDTFRARHTILATGGAGKVYLITTNPDIATGDGIAMAWRAGALIANMEFIQFHPTCLYHPQAKAFLISEAVRGEGGILKLKNGQPFMERYHPMKDLAPRDVVARAIDIELKKSGDDCVFLDISHRDRDYLLNRFPTIYTRCLQFGVDMAREAIPVVPAAHYLCGGVVVNGHGETNIDRLFAVGEVACTGLHGANRLASNSLLECVVFAHRAVERIGEQLPCPADEDLPIPPWQSGNATESDESIVIEHNWDEIRRCMWHYVGIVRSNKRLERAEKRMELMAREIHEYYWSFKITRDLLELRNISDIANLIVKCAMMRKESRGLHYNLDYPDRNDRHWQRDTVVRK